MQGTTITSEIRTILESAVCEGDLLKLPQSLDRPSYLKVDKILKAIGGKWNRSRKGHVFSSVNAQDVLDKSLGRDTVYANPLQYFWTPKLIGSIILGFGENRDRPARRLLEPSAGEGHLVRLMAEGYGSSEIVAIEIDPSRCETLRNVANEFGNIDVVEDDFLRWTKTLNPTDDGDRFDLVVMNPPFVAYCQETGKRLDQDVWIAHAEAAWDLLAPGGAIVCIVPASIEFSTQGAVAKFCKKDDPDSLSHNMDVVRLSDDAFKESGTQVSTCCLYAQKP